MLQEPTTCSIKMVIIHGFDVDFPYDQPYANQLALMSGVLHALEEQKNALLESPTGTGKTLSLLCASLEWQKRQKAAGETPPKIIYCSRTHSQLKGELLLLFLLHQWRRPRFTTRGSRCGFATPRNFVCAQDSAAGIKRDSLY